VSEEREPNEEELALARARGCDCHVLVTVDLIELCEEHHSCAVVLGYLHEPGCTLMMAKMADTN
jgi:hypothetical protein